MISRHKPVTTGLFIDLCVETSSSQGSKYAQYAIKRDDYLYEGRRYPSLYKLYMDFQDPSEYDFANHFLLNYEHWTTLSEHPKIKPYVMTWRHELELKIKADALNHIIQISKSESKDSLAAAKFLLTNKWFDKGEAHSRGRPKKQEVVEYLNDRYMEDKKAKDDFERMTTLDRLNS